MTKDIIEEFDRRINPDNYRREETAYGLGKILRGQDTLLDEATYPENEFELDADKIKEFLQKAITSTQEERDRSWRERIEKTIAENNIVHASLCAKKGEMYRKCAACVLDSLLSDTKTNEN